jgi:chloride channel 3/4/5
MGTLLIKLNVRAAIYRHNSFIAEWPLLEVVMVAAVTAIISYPVCHIFQFMISYLPFSIYTDC